MLQATSEEKGDRLVIRISGRLDAAGAKVVADALDRALKSGRHSVELDMGGVDYISSAGMRVLIIYYRKFSQLKGLFYLASVNEKVGRLLEMTGLYSLLEIRPGQDGPKTPDMRRISFDGWSLTFSEPEPGGFLHPHVIGSRVPDVTDHASGSRPEVLEFPPSTLAFGTGALGYDAADCTGRFGPFLAAGGYAAFRPAYGERTPDYVEYAEADIPRLHVLDAISLTGNYSHLLSFKSDASPPGPVELVQALLAAGTIPAAGFVIAAECERVEDSGPVREKKDEGKKKNPAGDTAPGNSTPGLMLAGGVGGGAGMTGLLWELLLPAGEGTDFFIHVHAAFFPYRPLRQRGQVKLKDTVAALFEEELQDVVHLGDLSKRSGRGGIRLLRGLVWFAPLRENTGEKVR